MSNTRNLCTAALLAGLALLGTAGAASASPAPAAPIVLHADGVKWNTTDLADKGSTWAKPSGVVHIVLHTDGSTWAVRADGTTFLVVRKLVQGGTVQLVQDAAGRVYTVRSIKLG